MKLKLAALAIAGILALWTALALIVPLVVHYLTR